jgi:hypothetical protein
VRALAMPANVWQRSYVPQKKNAVSNWRLEATLEVARVLLPSQVQATHGGTGRFSPFLISGKRRCTKNPGGVLCSLHGVPSPAISTDKCLSPSWDARGPPVVRARQREVRWCLVTVGEEGENGEKHD